VAPSPSTQPYLLRAIYDWAVDNGYTPHLLVDADAAGVSVPPGYARDGRITLNVHPQAVQGLELGNDWIRFGARFGGRHHDVHIPLPAVRGIYARENGQGIAFPPPGGEGGERLPPAPPPTAQDSPPTPAPPPKGRPGLRRVK
jgi:stringent starvation protein B